MMAELIVDSQLTPGEALAQNPDSPCPTEVLRELKVVEVEHLGFDQQRHLGQIVVHGSAESDIKAFFDLALDLGFPIEKVVPAADPSYQWDDEKMMADNNSSGFNWRPIAGTDEISQHGQGLAFDINPRQNPYIRYENGHEDGSEIIQPPGAIWRPGLRGVLYADHPLVKMMRLLGWDWGGNWPPASGRVDYQHFEKPGYL